MKGVHTLVLSLSHMTTGFAVALDWTDNHLCLLLRCRDPWLLWNLLARQASTENKCSFPANHSADERLSDDDMRCLSRPGDWPSISKSNCQNNPKFTWVMGGSQLRGESSSITGSRLLFFLVSTCMSIDKQLPCFYPALTYSTVFDIIPSFIGFIY